MDSLPQETIDAIIDNLPRSTLRSSSLVARRWRARSQQRIFYFTTVTFHSEHQVDCWHSDFQRGQNQIIPYVRCVEFSCIDSWGEPALFGRVLEDFCSLKTLKLYGCAIPDELPGQILHGRFGDGIIILSLRFPICDLSTITSMVQSLPNVKKLAVGVDWMMSQRHLPASNISQGRSFDVLELYDDANGVAEAFIQSRFTSRRICLGGGISSVHRLVAISSRLLVALMLEGVWFSYRFPSDRSSTNNLRRYHGRDAYPSHRSTIVSLSRFPTCYPV
jgi:hypothetical protein